MAKHSEIGQIVSMRYRVTMYIKALPIPQDIKTDMIRALEDVHMYFYKYKDNNTVENWHIYLNKCINRFENIALVKGISTVRTERIIDKLKVLRF